MANNPYNRAKTTGELTKQVAIALTDRRLRLTTAESCTGEAAAALCAEEDTAAFYDIGLITFSDRAKQNFSALRLRRWKSIAPSVDRPWKRCRRARWSVPERISASR